MKKFEYLVELFLTTTQGNPANRELKGFLNSFGEKGWELVSANQLPELKGFERFYFKREVENEK